MTYLYSVNMPFRYAILMPQLTTLSYVSYLFALQCIISYSLTALLAPLYKFFMSLRFSTPWYPRIRTMTSPRMPNCSWSPRTDSCSAIPVYALATAVPPPYLPTRFLRAWIFNTCLRGKLIASGCRDCMILKTRPTLILSSPGSRLSTHAQHRQPCPVPFRISSKISLSLHWTCPARLGPRRLLSCRQFQRSVPIT